MTTTDRASAAIETAVGVPAFLLFLALILGAGRVALAREAVEAAAAEGARSASIARTQALADQAARAGTTAVVDNQGLHCALLRISADTSQFARPVGVPATVSVTVSCDVDLSDLVIPGLPGTIPITVTMDSPLDTYRGR
ncbi:MAG: pilus assembly protein [Actinobacteria bacterium]|nr:pilus assembly protein [Actinomycetota bacterium]